MVYDILKFGLAGIAVLCGIGAAASRARRYSFVSAAVCAGSAAIAAQYQIFWATVVFALGVVWALWCTLPSVDLAWRAKVGMTFFLGLGAAIAVFPTYHDERYGRDASLEALPTEQRVATEAAMRAGDHGLRAWLTSNIPFRLLRGLDLKGGLRLVYTVEVEEAIKDKRDRYYDEIRAALSRAYGFTQGEANPSIEELKKLAARARFEKPRDQADTLHVVFEDPADSTKIDDAFLKRFQAELQLFRSPDRKVATFRIRSNIESAIRERAVTQAKETIRRRIDGMGLKEVAPTVRDEDIILEVPGDDERAFREIREIISQTARLEFKLLDDDVNYLEAHVSGKPEDLPKGLSFLVEDAPVGPNKSKPIYYARMVRLEGESMAEALDRLKEWVTTLNVPDDHEIGYGRLIEFDPDAGVYKEVGWRTYYLWSKAEITGDQVREAFATPDQSDRSLGGWYVSMEMTPAGGDRFEEITGANVKRRFAIILDGKVESAPVIQNKIPGGRAQITMGSADASEQLEDARRLELVLRSGALPAPISQSNEQRIGPSLGRDAIEEGVKGAIAGSCLVLLFMAWYYRRAGVIADIAVLFNLLLQVAILAMFNAAMTLPGIAGLALTIGIAVDANVLINERIREELRQGKSARTAVEIGYDKAFSAILDGHVTGVIAGLILWQYGTGPIQGFAVTLIVGIAVSLFTGVVTTRLMFDWAVRGRRVRKLSVG